MPRSGIPLVAMLVSDDHAAAGFILICVVSATTSGHYGIWTRAAAEVISVSIIIHSSQSLC